MEENQNVTLFHQQAALDFVNEPILILDENLKIVFMNKSFIKFSNLEKNMYYDASSSVWYQRVERHLLLQGFLPDASLFLSKLDAIINAALLSSSNTEQELVVPCIKQLDDAQQSIFFSRVSIQATKMVNNQNHLSCTCVWTQFEHAALQVLSEVTSTMLGVLEFVNTEDDAIIHSANAPFADKYSQQLSDMIGKKLNRDLGLSKELVTTLNQLNMKSLLQRNSIVKDYIRITPESVSVFSQDPPTQQSVLEDEIWLSVSVSNLGTSILGQHVFALAFEDITDSKRLKVELENNLELRETKDLFFASLSHELRTPLTAVIGMANVLADSPNLTVDQRECVTVIQACGDSLLLLLNDVLDLSKMQSGKLELAVEEFNVRHCVDEAVNMMSAAASQKNIELIVDIPSSTQQTCLGDVLRVKQIVINLLSNALKFTQKGEVVVRVHSKHEDDLCEYTFTVEDTGIGIPEEAQDKLFKAFSQVDPFVSQKYGGTGLGLAICRYLCELHNGRIWLKTDKQQKRTMFYFTIISKAITNKRSSIGISESLGLIDLCRKTLILDKNKTLCQVLKREMETLGFPSVSHYQSLDDLLNPNAVNNFSFYQQQTSNNNDKTNNNNTNSQNNSEESLKGGTEDIEDSEVAFLFTSSSPSLLNNPPSLRESQPNLILLSTDFDDHSIHGSNSIVKNASGILKQCWPNTPIIYFGSSRPSFQPQPFIKKPIKLDYLIDALHHVFGTANSNVFKRISTPTPVALSNGKTFAESHPMSILIAEDNLVNQKVLQKLLSSVGYESSAIFFVRDGLEAVVATLNRFPDVVFMDFEMPGLDGNEATRRIRHALDLTKSDVSYHPFIIGLTANASKRHSDQAFSAGMDYYLTKPLKTDALLKALYAGWRRKNHKQNELFVPLQFS